MIRLSDTLMVNNHITSKELDGVLYLLNPERGHLHTCNTTAKLIWQAVEKKTQVKDIVTMLQRAYAVDYGTAKKDTFAFLEKMIKQDMVKTKRSVKR